MPDPTRPEQPIPGDAWMNIDPLGLMTDAEYLAWLDDPGRRPVEDAEREEARKMEENHGKP